MKGYERKGYRCMAAATMALSFTMCSCSGKIWTESEDAATGDSTFMTDKENFTESKYNHTDSREEGNEIQTGNQAFDKEESIVSLYRDIYEEAMHNNVSGFLEMRRNIVQNLGAHGYTAVDSGNQIDMMHPEQALQFCESVKKQERADLTVIVVMDSDGFMKYDFSTENGQVEVSKGYYQYDSESFFKKTQVSYIADSWQYTKEGYLIFTGSTYSEESYVLTMSDVPEIAALRVEPLDERCREYNRQYVLPVGYRSNNIFLCDWDEDDYGDLDFYDVFDRFYQEIYGQPVPYVADQDISIGAVYQIPEEEFENVVMRYFPIDCETLRSKTKYLSKDRAYEYRPRGFYEVEYSNLPYPEVVGQAENEDGTITLTVNAVYPSEETAKAYTHEVVVRPLEDGVFQYVSNHRILSRDDYATGWHTDRLTEDEWEEIYGKGGNGF